MLKVLGETFSFKERKLRTQGIRFTRFVLNMNEITVDCMSLKTMVKVLGKQFSFMEGKLRTQDIRFTRVVLNIYIYRGLTKLSIKKSPID
jgi:hypothetical protein